MASDSDVDELLGGMSGYDNPIIGQTRPYQGTSGSDLMHVVGENASGLLSGFYSTMSERAQAAGNDELSRYNQTVAKQWNDSAKYHRDAQSQDTQDLADAGLFSSQTLRHPITKALIAVAQNAIPGAAGLAGEALAGPIGAALPFMAANIVGAHQRQMDQIQSMSDEDKRNKIPGWAEDVDSGLSKDDADRKAINKAAIDSHLDVLAGAAGILGGAPAFGGLTGKISNWALRGVVGGGEAGLGMGLQDLGTNLALNQSSRVMGVPEMSPQELQSSAVQAGIGMAPLGGFGGMFHRFRGKGEEGEPEQKEQEQRAQQDSPTQAQTDAAGTRAAGPPLSTALNIGAGTPYRGRPSDLPAAVNYPADRGEASQTRHETPVHSENAAGIDPGGRGEGQTKHEGAAEALRTTDTTVDTTSSPVADDQAAALSETNANRSARMKDRHAKAKALSDATGRPYTDFRGMSDTDLKDAHDKLQAVNKPQPEPVKQPEVVQPEAGVQKPPTETAGPPIQPGPGTTTPEPAKPATVDPTLAGAGISVDDRTAEAIRQHDELQRWVDQQARQPPPAARVEAPRAETAAESTPYDDRTAAELARHDAIQQWVKDHPPPVQKETVQKEPVESLTAAVRPEEEVGAGLQDLQERIRAAAEAGPPKPTKRVVKPLEEQKPGHLTKAQIKTIEDRNAVAKKIINAHKPKDSDWNAEKPEVYGGKGARGVLMSRLKDMVNTFDKTKHEWPQAYRKAPEGAITHSKEMLILDMAKRLIDRVREGKVKRGEYDTFVTRERALREGNEKVYDTILRERHKEADDRMAVKTGKVRALKEGELEKVAEETPAEEHEPTEFTKAGETWEEAKTRRGDISSRLPKIPKEGDSDSQWEIWEDELKSHRLAKLEAKREGIDLDDYSWPQLAEFQHSLQRIQDQVKGAGPPRVTKVVAEKAGPPEPAKVGTFGERFKEARAAAKAKAETEKGIQERKPTIEELKAELERRAKLQAVKDEDEGPKGQPVEKETEGKPSEAKPTPVTTRNINGEEITIGSRRAPSTARAVMDQYFNVNKYPKVLRPMVQAVYDRVLSIAGDTPVHFISDEDMNRVMGGRFRGAYIPHHDHILINESYIAHDTAFHEAFHAATAKAIAGSAVLKKLITRLRTEITMAAHAQWAKYTPEEQDRLEYAFSNNHEFLTGMMTNPIVQDHLKEVRISDKLARDIGLPKWRRATAFNAFVQTVLHALNLSPKYHSAVEATLALTEQAMWKRDPLSGWSYARRLYQVGEDDREGLERPLGQAIGQTAKQPVDDEDWKTQGAFQRSAKEHIASVRNLEAAVVKRHANDTYKNLKTSLLHHTTKLLSIDQMDRIHGAVAPHVRAIGQIMNKIHHYAMEGRMGDQALRLRAWMFERTHQNELEDFSRITRLMSQYQIDPNSTAAPKAGTLKRELYDRFKPEVDDIWNNKLSPEGKKLLVDMQSQYREYNQVAGRHAVKDLGKTYQLSDAIVKRALSDSLDRDDKKLLEEMGIRDRMSDAIDKIHGNTIYFARERPGPWTVHARFDMPDGGYDKDMVGDALADDMREFDTEDEARKYATEQNTYGLHPTMSTAYYGIDPETQQLRKMTEIDARQVAPIGQEPAHRYRVRLERDYMERARTIAEGGRLREAMLKAGVNPKTLTDVLPSEKEDTWTQITRSNAFQRAEEQRINRLNIPDVEKKRLVEASRQVMMTSQVGSSLRKHQIKRDEVFGGHSGTAEGLDAYSRMHHFAMAKAEMADELTAAVDKMDEHERENRGDGNGTRRGIINDEVKRRLYEHEIIPAKSARWLRTLMNYSFLNFLMRPSHVFLQQIHPWIYSMPELIARHGWKSVGVYGQSMRDLGGDQAMTRLKMLAKGGQAAIDIARAFKEKDIDKAVKLAQGWNPIQEMILNIKDKDERDAMVKMYESGHFHSAFDVSLFNGDGFNRSNAMLQQLTQAMEATNRLSVGLTAYRLEKAAHGDHANALEFARRRIETSMGVYTPSNIAPYLKNPLLRAMMQFHQMPMNLAISLYHNMYKALPEIAGGQANWEARKTLAYQLGTAAALGGMGGMPMDVPKVAGLASQALGGPSPEDYDNKFHMALANMLGPEIANIIENGLPALAGPFGPVLGHRTGFSSDLIFGEPASGSSADITTWLADNIGGASWSTVTGWHDTLAHLEAGDYERAAATFLPGSIRDVIKAYRDATEGTMWGNKQIKPESFGNALIQALGFQPIDQARAYAGHIALQKEIKAERSSRRQIMEDGTIGDVMRWNAKHPQDRITPIELQRMKQARQKDTLGLSIPRWEQQRAKRYQEAYQ